MVRTIAIWVFGLIAGLIIGGFLGGAFDAEFNPHTTVSYNSFAGGIAGMCVFGCLRLWLAGK